MVELSERRREALRFLGITPDEWWFIQGRYEQVLQMLDDVSAIAANMLAHSEHAMSPADREGRGVIIREARALCDRVLRPEEDEPPSSCTGECRDMAGKNWVYTGTAYGGDDPSHFGEGRCYCQFCGADGDG